MGCGCRVAACVLLAAPALAAAAAAGTNSTAQASSSIRSYEDFRSIFRRAENVTGSEYASRRAIFQARRAAVEAHNAQPGKSWTATLNRLSDYTEDEMWALMGYRRHATWSPAVDATGGEGGLGRGTSFLQMRQSQGSQGSAREDLAAATVDWRARLSRSLGASFVRDQGRCGSCWAVAAVGALETRAELAGLASKPLSYEQLVDCTQNPKHCGGDGGCGGATSELAFEAAMKNGVVPEESYVGYKHGGQGRCDLSQNKKEGVRVSSWTRLPSNRLEPVLAALQQSGPAVVSVDAGSWNIYDKGVFNSCDRDATVNHAVLAVGYGHDTGLGKKYWLIRNSWGGDWGESGFIRLQRHDSDSGADGWCGTDRDPHQGFGCDGGAGEIPVCGMCGILSDVSHPNGVVALGGAPERA